MRTLSKFVLFLALVLTLAILLQPQHSLCASIPEYPPTWVVYGEIAIAKDNIFQPAEIVFQLQEGNSTGSLLTGMLSIVSDKYNKTFYFSSFTSLDGKTYMTTTGSAILYSPDGWWVLLQIPNEGITGTFTPEPLEP